MFVQFEVGRVIDPRRRPFLENRVGLRVRQELFQRRHGLETRRLHRALLQLCLHSGRPQRDTLRRIQVGQKFLIWEVSTVLHNAIFIKCFPDSRASFERRPPTWRATRTGWSTPRSLAASSSTAGSASLTSCPSFTAVESTTRVCFSKFGIINLTSF